MKIHQEDNLILTNSTNEKKFTIQASAKAFQILSSALYSRKVEAIIRELGCNAADSHIQAGCPDLPFVVHLPNSWEPEFYVEDFGVGLDADDVENIYTSYFTSTKTDSNDVTGGFGLGSKTPFSYCDSFNIRTRKNGFEYHFNAFINMQGEPATSLFSKTETTEPNGVRVSVPVKVTDFQQFRDDARKVYKWFTVVPTIMGGVNGEVLIDNSTAVRLQKEGAFWSEYSVNGYNRNTITVVMGNVSYHVPKITETFSVHFNSSERQFFEHNSLFIQFNIGDLDVAASRETISFVEDTEKAFIKRVKEVIASFCKETQDKLDGEIKTVQDAVSLVSTEVGTWANDMFTYNGESVHKWAETNFVKKLQHSIDIDGYYFARTRKGTVKRHSLDYIGQMTFAKLAEKNIIVLVGSDKGFQTIARQLCHTSSDLYGVFFIEEAPDDAATDELYELFGGYLVFENAAELILADKAKRKAERERLRALAGPTARVNTAPRISRDSLRASKVYKVSTDPVTGSVSGWWREKHVVTAADVVGKKYIVLVERYNAGIVSFKHPISGVVHKHDLSSSSEQWLFNFCRLFNLDMVIFIKPENVKKAEKMFVDAIEVVEDINQDLLQAMQLRKILDVKSDDFISELVLEHTDYGLSRKLRQRLIDNTLAYVEKFPDGELAQVPKKLSVLHTYDSLGHIPVILRHVVLSETQDFVNAVSQTTETIYNELRVNYPLAFLGDIEDCDDLDDYIYYMDKLRELDLIIKPPVLVVDDEKEVEEVVDDELEAA